jgi:hypothetical protein
MKNNVVYIVNRRCEKSKFFNEIWLFIVFFILVENAYNYFYRNKIMKLHFKLKIIYNSSKTEYYSLTWMCIFLTKYKKIKIIKTTISTNKYTWYWTRISFSALNIHLKIIEEKDEETYKKIISRSIIHFRCIIVYSYNAQYATCT